MSVFQDIGITDTITSNGDAVTLDFSGLGLLGVYVSGTWVATLQFEGSIDETNWFAIKALNISTGAVVSSIAGNGTFLVPVAGYAQFRLRASAYTSGTATVTIEGTKDVTLNLGDKASTGDINVSDGLKNGGVHGNLAMATGGTAYEAKVGGSRLANRKLLTIVALDDMYWGYDNTVTTSSGTPLYKNQFISFAINPDSGNTFQIWVVASGNNKNARITESP